MRRAVRAKLTGCCIFPAFPCYYSNIVYSPGPKRRRHDALLLASRRRCRPLGWPVVPLRSFLFYLQCGVSFFQASVINVSLLSFLPLSLSLFSLCFVCLFLCFFFSLSAVRGSSWHLLLMCLPYVSVCARSCFGRLPRIIHSLAVEIKEVRKPHLLHCSFYIFNDRS